jgi:rfaE bifunctional protein kinase chain/domain
MAKMEQLHDIVNRMSGKRIAVLGDYMLDRYIWGSVSRISPEAPVPVVEVQRESTVPGGAGNVVRNLAAIGVVPLVCGVIGRDEAGANLSQHLTEMGGQLEPLLQAQDCSTTMKIRVIGNRQQVVRVDYDHGMQLSEKLHQDLVDATLTAFRGADAVVFSDYSKGTMTASLCRNLLSEARQMHLPVCVDPKPYSISHYHGATLISPNETEANSATGIHITDDASAVTAARKLQADGDLDAAVITRGGKGMCLCEAEGPAHLIPAVNTEVFDVTGAGDTSIAVLCAAIASGASFLQATIIANTAGGEVVRHIGCATVTPERLHQALDENATAIESIRQVT